MPISAVQPSEALPASTSEALAEWLPKQRWFAGKARQIRRVEVIESAAVGAAQLWELGVTFEDGGVERYALPVSSGTAEVPEQAVILPLADGGVLFDAVYDPSFRAELFRSLAGIARDTAGFSATHGALIPRLFPSGEVPESRVLPAEQSNTSLIYGERLFVKFYRRRVEGLNPDAEITRYLSEAAGFPHVPAFGGELRWAGASLALATELRPNQGDAWARALREFARWVQDDRALDPWLQAVRRLGCRTGQMHLTLADRQFHQGEWADFAPEVMSPAEVGKLRQLRTRADDLVALLRKNDQVPPGPDADFSVVENVLITLEDHGGYVTQRTHGDYHLGQVLCTGDDSGGTPLPLSQGPDFLLIDFEGEPARTLAERRAKHPPIRDVAGLLRSFHYAAHAANETPAVANENSTVAEAPRPRATLEQAETWTTACQHAFLQAWRETVHGTLVADERLLRYYLVEKALYEIDYELNNRPAWLHIPLRGLQAAGNGWD